MRESERERAKLERESAHVNERERERESADRTAAAPRRERFRGRAGVLCFVLARAPHAVGRGTVRCRAGARTPDPGPGRAVTGGVHLGVRSVCAGGVRAREREPCEITLQCCRSQPRALFRCSAAAEYERGRALLPLAARDA